MISFSELLFSQEVESEIDIIELNGNPWERQSNTKYYLHKDWNSEPTHFCFFFFSYCSLVKDFTMCSVISSACNTITLFGLRRRKYHKNNIKVKCKENILLTFYYFYCNPRNGRERRLRMWGFSVEWYFWLVGRLLRCFLNNMWFLSICYWNFPHHLFHRTHSFTHSIVHFIPHGFAFEALYLVISRRLICLPGASRCGRKSRAV